MKDIALASEGTRVYFATCRDDKYPLDNIIDGKWDTFWPTSGLYPHSFIVTFRTIMQVHTIVVQVYNVKSMTIDKSMEDQPKNFSRYLEKELEHEDRKMQTFSTNEGCVARHFRFNILAGYDHFVSINNLQIMADAADKPNRSPVVFEYDTPVVQQQQQLTLPVSQSISTYATRNPNGYSTQSPSPGYQSNSAPFRSQPPPPSQEWNEQGSYQNHPTPLKHQPLTRSQPPAYQSSSNVFETNVATRGFQPRPPSAPSPPLRQDSPVELEAVRRASSPTTVSSFESPPTRHQVLETGPIVVESESPDPVVIPTLGDGDEDSDSDMVEDLDTPIESLQDVGK